MRPRRPGRGPRLAGAVLLVGAALGLAAPAGAAPLDALLGAAPLGATTADGWHAELGIDKVDDRLDVFGLRSSDPRYAGTRIGDYGGHHLRLARSTERWQVDAALWQRRLQDRNDRHRFTSWQLGGQFRLDGSGDAVAAGAGLWALRVSAWGNRAQRLNRTTSTRLNVEGLDTLVREVQIDAPVDRQIQLDLIHSRRWQGDVASRHQASVFAGAIVSRVGNAGVTGRSTIGACAYQLEFGANELVAHPDGSCGNGLTIRIPNQLLPYAAGPETNYHARAWHAGLSHHWQGEVWGTRLGYDFQHWQRAGIDRLIEQRGGTAWTSNHVLVTELDAHLGGGVGAFLRAQIMRHQFVGELPLAYNTLSASRFGKTYGYATLGLTAEF